MISRTLFSGVERSDKKREKKKGSRRPRAASPLQQEPVGATTMNTFQRGGAKRQEKGNIEFKRLYLPEWVGRGAGKNRS